MIIQKLFNSALPLAATAYNKGAANKAGYRAFYIHVNNVRSGQGGCGDCAKRARAIVTQAYKQRQTKEKETVH